jgi:hypothetical protein
VPWNDEVNQWVMWQMANQGPKLGDGHFRRLGDREGDQKYGVNRSRGSLRQGGATVSDAPGCRR